MKPLRTILARHRTHRRRLAAPASAQWTVFDASTLRRTCFEAARALQQINNQIQSLQNEAMMLQNMGKNLQSLNTSQLGTMASALNQISTLMNQAAGIAFNVSATQYGLHTDLSAKLSVRRRSTATLEADAQKRWQNSMAAFQQTLTMQAQVAQNVQADTGHSHRL